MNWTTFLLTLTLVYLAYYGLNLLYDLLTARKSPGSESTGDVLFFDEDVRPEIIEPEDDPLPQPHTEPSGQAPDKPDAPPPTEAAPPAGGLSGKVFSTGAVGLKELFNLAKDNLIEYTGDISYG